MQNAETVLHVLHECGRRALPCEELYRQLAGVIPSPGAQLFETPEAGTSRISATKIAARTRPASAMAWIA